MPAQLACAPPEPAQVLAHPGTETDGPAAAVRVARARHEVAATIGEGEHVVDREDRTDLVGGEDEDEVAFRVGDAGAYGVHDAGPDGVQHPAQVRVCGPQRLDDGHRVV